MPISLNEFYSQNFQSLANTATNNTALPPGWEILETGGGARDNEQYGADTGNSNTGDIYSYGSSGSTERALGGLQSGSLIPLFGSSYTNNSSNPITTLTISYTGEQWRLGTLSRPDRLDFQYSLDANSLTTGTWLNIDALDFNSPVTTGVVGALDGNAAANRTRITATITGLNIGVGATFWLRWQDFNATGADEGLAIDDFTLSTTVPTLPTVSITATDPNAAEAGQDPATFRISRTGPNTNPLSVNYIVASGGRQAANGTDYTLPLSGTVTIADGQSFVDLILTPVDDTDVEGNESVILTLAASGEYVVGPSTIATAVITDDDAGPSVRIRDIQGSGHVSSLNGSSVIGLEGVVTAVAANGFYLQDPVPDSIEATSEGIFIFTGSTPSVVMGDALRISGTVTEFRPGGNPNNLTITEITSPFISIVSSGNPLPAAIILGIGGRPIPSQLISSDVGNVENSGSFNPGQDGIDFYESLEGMRVQINNPLTTSPTASFGSSEEIWVLADNGVNATNRTQNGGSLIIPTDFNPERIQIDDLINSISIPASNVGTQFNTIIGVVSYDFNNYEVLVTTAPTVVLALPLQKEVTTLTATAGQLTLATFNVENLDPGDGIARFAALATAIVNNLGSPDIFNLEEVQDNNGPTNNGVVDASLTFETLIAAIAAAGGPSYDYRQINPIDNQDGGEPGGNIRVGFLFNPNRVSFVEGSLQRLTDPNPGETDRFPGDDFASSRKPLVGTFSFNGQQVTVIGNHFNSKGGDQPLFGPNQPPTLNSELQRDQQSTIVRNYVQSILLRNPDTNVVVAGDLNDFEFSSPLTLLKNGGLTNLVETIPQNQRYTYNFQGNAQVLDHILVSPNLFTQMDGFDVVHMNSEFADQVSDHDPTIARFNLPAPPPPNYTLQILSYYGESGLLGVETAPILGALIDRFDDQYANTLKLGEGDTSIPGPWLIGGADPSLNSVPGIGSTALGRPDIAIFNAYGTDASALGNHEFDLGSPVLQGAIAFNNNSTTTTTDDWVGAQFPFITANLDFARDSSLRGLSDATIGGTSTNAFAGKEASSIKAKIAPYAIVTEVGEKIGLVGATTYDLLSKSSPNGTVPKDDGLPSTSDLQEVAAYIQTAVDALRALGVNKIVMLDQLDTIERNRLLAPLVSGIDVMVAGGGHERLGDATDVSAAFNGHDSDFVDTYPIVTAGADSKPLLIVTTDTEFTYLGRLVVEFDANGEILLSKLNPALNGAYAAIEATLQAAYGTSRSAAQIVASSSIGSQVNAITQAINNVIVSKDSNIFGYTNVYLEGDRVFGRTQEVNLGDITADANLFKARQALGAGTVLTSLKNGGGIRASIGSIGESGEKLPPAASGVKPAGAISQLDVENALRFDNKLMVFDATPQQLLNILEFAAGLSSGSAQQSGGYAQIGGVHFSYDPSRPAGQKVQDVAIYNESGNLVAKVTDNGQLLAGAPPSISVVILSFTANGGDGYPIKANGQNFRYLLANGTLSGPVDESLNFTADTTHSSLGLIATDVLGEQKALEDFLGARHGTPATAFDITDTPASLDLRIQNLRLKAQDTVLSLDTLPNGVASGDVDQDSVVLWTRSTALGQVRFEYATTADFAQIAGSAVASVTNSNQPVKVEITGLNAGTDYFYRVSDAAGSVAQGRFETAASAGQFIGLSFGVSGDWRGEIAPYPAIGNASGQALDFFVELGDTIYADVPSDAVLNADGSRKAQTTSLDEFRAKHNEAYSVRYGVNTLEDLRGSTAIYAVIDDHEVTNDFAGGAPAASDPRFGSSQGLINDTDLFENGLTAFQEYNPIRDVFYGDSGDSRTAGERDLYRFNSFGSDAASFLLDTRSFRDSELIAPNTANSADVARFLNESLSMDRTLLGAAQISRLKADLLSSQVSGITWKFVMVPEPIQELGIYNTDAFEGYAKERRDLLKFIEDNGIHNVVFVAADIHGTMVNNLTYTDVVGGPRIATDVWEITTGSVGYSKPFGQTVVDFAAAAGLLSPIEKGFYDSLPIAPDGDNLLNDKDDFLKSAFQTLAIGPAGYDPIGLDRNLTPGSGGIGSFDAKANLLQGDYAAAHTYGWTKFDIDPATQQLTVTTYGINPYSEADLNADPANVLARVPRIISQFTVEALNQAPNAVGLSATTFDENIMDGSLVANLSSSDPDRTPQSFTYALVAGAGDTDNLAFFVTGNELHLTRTPDYERKSSYNIRLKSTDQGGLSFERSVQLAVNDLPDSPSYTFSSSASTVYEGAGLAFGISSSNVAPGTQLYWSFSGSGITGTDFVDRNISGTNMLGADGRASFTKTIADDGFIEGDEGLSVKFFSDSARTQQLGSTILVTIKELSVGVVTNGPDIIIGTAADETIRGVPTGSTQRGRGTVDKLTGGGGNDSFVLGDASGVFYDDGNPAVPETKDMAWITDFSVGDKIILSGSAVNYQLTSARYSGLKGVQINALLPASTPEPIGFVQAATLESLKLSNHNQFAYA
jgi:predicted extracellular nuclease/phosphodiesterase/alkaline phosphatase D-like protein/2',3'-cyclic-nucleotide 2'-phosphodiesterase (5'-nucleotidase family)